LGGGHNAPVDDDPAHGPARVGRLEKEVAHARVGDVLLEERLS
jgi:hypothetical protein